MTETLREELIAWLDKIQMDTAMSHEYISDIFLSLVLSHPEWLKEKGFVRLDEDQTAPMILLQHNLGEGKNMVTQDYLNGRASVIRAGFRKIKEST